jgi:mono/diheme cytochrome c family protein
MMHHSPGLSLRRLLRLIGLAAAVGVNPIGAAQAYDDVETDAATQSVSQRFLRDVLPLLEKRCFGCHGPESDREGALDLRSREGMLKGGESGEPALVPGHPEQSPLFTAVLREGDLVMPPQQRNALTPEEVALLREWIAAGAVWAMSGDVAEPAGHSAEGQGASADGVLMATSGGLSPAWTNRRYPPEDVWAYRPIQRPEVPRQVIDDSSEPNPIDAFIAAALEEAGIESLGPPADRRTLLRRLTFDLTGLPPTPGELDAFEQDESPDAYLGRVDELLARPSYGEQLARQWLDVVRYADTSGFANDYERPNAWRYRDYVIRSFNADKPFDRFIIEQIAGDELDESDPENLIAVGFLRMGPWEQTGMSVKAVTRQMFLDDVAHHVGQTLLGQGLRCCKCHDHKFDPLPTKDYYRFQANFAPVQFAHREVPYLPEENTGGFERMKQRTRRLLDDAQQTLDRLVKKSAAAVDARVKELGYAKFDEVPKPERPKKGFYGLSQEELSEKKIAEKRRAYFERELVRYEPLAFSLYNGPDNNFTSTRAVSPMPPPARRRGDTDVVHILTGGALEAPAEAVSPGVLSAMAGANDALTPSAWNTLPDAMHGRRLALANWIASPSNTLTARVIVNRIWQRHFGNGLVATSNNFGRMGDKPSHPELLDWLATWFLEHGWSIKKLDRLILTSQTYRQSSRREDIPALRQSDPNNRLLAYFPTRRLSAEELRDSLLAITGELNPEAGGPGVFPEINWEVARQPRHIMGSIAPAYIPSPDPRQRHRRTIFAFRYRTLPDPLLEVFNRPGADISCERRDETTVTPQVFAWFNGQYVHDRALALADRIHKQGQPIEDQVRAVFREVLGRSPGASELEMSLEHVQQMLAQHQLHDPPRVDPPQTVRRSYVEELTGEDFVWDEELIGMDQFVADLKPWQVDPPTRTLGELCLVLMNSNEFVYVR